MVGAGPAGVHMALKLKKLGYKDIILYEKSGPAKNGLVGCRFDSKFSPISSSSHRLIKSGKVNNISLCIFLG